MDILAVLLKESRTKDEVKQKLWRLQGAAKSQFFGGEESVSALSTGEKEVLASLTASNAMEKLTEAEKELEEQESLIIYLPFSAGDEETAKISAMVGGDWMIDFKVDRNLIGGCALVWKGVYKDYSLRAKFSENRERIMAEFDKYLEAK